MNSLLIGLIVLATSSRGSSYSAGAPVVQCAQMTPCHTAPQEGDPPIEIRFSSPCYTPAVPLNIEIEAPNGFKGIYVQVRKENTNTIADGTFENIDLTKFKLVSCRPGRNNAFTNRNSREKSNVSFTWKASSSNTENLELVYTFVETYLKIWVRAKKSIPKCSE